MPYTISKRGSKYCLVRKNGTVKSRHASKVLAQSARRAIMGSEHGWSPSGKPRQTTRESAWKGGRKTR